MDLQPELNFSDPLAGDGLFLAIYPDPHTAALIESEGLRLHASLGLTGKLSAPERFHLTLLYLGSYREWPNDAMQHALQVCAQVAMAPFNLTLDQVTTLDSGGMTGPAVLICGQPSGDLAHLHQILHEAHAAAGLLPPDRPFAPHLTLAYEERPITAQSVDPLTWTVHEFTLIRSVRDPATGRVVEHRRLGTWPLQA